MNYTLYIICGKRRDGGLYRGTDISQTVHVHWFSGFI